MNTFNFPKKYSVIIVSVITAVMPIISSILLISVYKTSNLYILIGVLLSIPNILAVKYQQFFKLTQNVNLVILLFIVLLCSENLWYSILNQHRVDLSLQLLILLLSLAFAAVLQLLTIISESEDNKDGSLLIDLTKNIGGLNLAIAFSVGLILCNLIMLWLPNIASLGFLKEKMLARGVIPPMTLTLFFGG